MMYADKGSLRNRELLRASRIIPEAPQKGTMGTRWKSKLYGSRAVFLMEVGRVVAKNMQVQSTESYPGSLASKNGP